MPSNENGQSPISYASVVSTPNGTLRHPRVLTQTLSSRSPSTPRTHIPPPTGPRSRTKWSVHAFSKHARPSTKRQDSRMREPIAGPRYEQSPKPMHRPNTRVDEECVYVLTLKMSDDILTAMNEMRKEWFPKKLNRTPAHLTLFHALPHSQRDVVEASIEAIASRIRPFQVATGRPFRMRRGVGIALGTGIQEAKLLHDRLRGEWVQFLSEQDQGGWRPHWTVINKEDNDERVTEAFEVIRTGLHRDDKDGTANGLDLWKYGRGNWEWTKEFVFVGNERAQDVIRLGGPPAPPNGVGRPHTTKPGIQRA